MWRSYRQWVWHSRVFGPVQNSTWQYERGSNWSHWWRCRTFQISSWQWPAAVLSFTGVSDTVKQSVMWLVGSSSAQWAIKATTLLGVYLYTQQVDEIKDSLTSWLWVYTIYAILTCLTVSDSWCMWCNHCFVQNVLGWSSNITHTHWVFWLMSCYSDHVFRAITSSTVIMAHV